MSSSTSQAAGGHLANLLSEIRRRRGLTLRQVALASKVNNPAICQIEQGNTVNPSARVLIRLMKFYHLDLDIVKEAMDKDALIEGVRRKGEVNAVQKGKKEKSVQVPASRFKAGR